MMANLNGLNPIVREATERLIANCKARGVDILITQAYRSIAEQNAIYAQGRTTTQLRAVGISNVEGKPKDAKVSDAKGGQSYHNYGIAIDFCLLINGKQASWSMLLDGDLDGVRDWAEVVNEAKKLGFAWGGDWTGWKDYSHFEMTLELSIADLQRGKKPPTSLVAKTVAVKSEPGASTPKAIPPYPGKLIRIGSTGKDVERIQRAVGVKPTGKFDKATETAVKAYQKRKGLTADGLIGRATWEVMF